MVERLTGHEKSSSNSWRRENHRIDVPPTCSIPEGGWFFDRYGTGGFRAAAFFATTPVSREALDHRLFSPTASGVVLCPRGFRMWTLVSGYVF